jgi:hypothetical protein
MSLRYPLPGGPDSGMPQVGCGGFRRRFCLDETLRGQSDSRRHSQTSLQNTADQARHARFIDIRGNAFGFGLAARAEIGLIPFAKAMANEGRLRPCKIRRSR